MGTSLSPSLKYRETLKEVVTWTKVNDFWFLRTVKVYVWESTTKGKLKNFHFPQIIVLTCIDKYGTPTFALDNSRMLAE